MGSSSSSPPRLSVLLDALLLHACICGAADNVMMERKLKTGGRMHAKWKRGGPASV